jgi:anhydro-N-acetylmuramic acid kinase
MKGLGPEISVELLHYRECAHDPEVNRQVRGAADLDVRAIAELNIRVGEAFAAACLETSVS